MRNLLALLLFLPSLCLAQVPNYVSTDGLVAWYSFNGNAEDQSGNGHHGVVSGATPSVDENDAPSGSYYFDGNARIDIDDHDDFDWVEMTILITYQDFDNPTAYPNGNSNMVSKVPGSGWGSGFGFGLGGDMAEFGRCMTTTSGNECLAWGENEYGEWRTVVYTHSIDSVKVYFDSFLVSSEEASGGFISNDLPITIGMRGNGWHEFIGSISRLAFWNRALTESEIESLFNQTSPTSGCTDPTACNYDGTANADDGSCEYGCLYCGEGTVWDSTLAQCISIADTIYIEPIACAPSCGEGTVWDPVNEECIIAIPADLNYDGCVSVNDLLILLAVHGTCPPYPEWPDEPTDTTWTCGDPLSYWDYDYATVLIGDQCWFAENLRTDKYADGTEIPDVTDNNEWSSLSTGARSLYASSDAYGLLYNWYAVESTMNLCPNQWQVSSAQDWNELESYIGNQGFEGNEGTALKFTYGWNGPGNGTNDFGFSGQPGGLRNPANGSFANGGWYGYWWTSTLNETGGLSRFLGSFNPMIEESSPFPQSGFSVRCIKD